jgi:signal peptidase II
MQERGAAPPLSDGERPRRDALRRLLLAGGVAVVVVAVDQATKTWAVDRLSRGPIHVVWKLDLQLTYNSGAAFSFAQGWGPVLGAVAVVAVLVMLGAVRRVQSTPIAVALGLVVGGALGNLSDRVLRHHGAVIDFIALHFWPTFNVADSCIVVGGIMAGVLLWHADTDR